MEFGANLFAVFTFIILLWYYKHDVGSMDKVAHGLKSLGPEFEPPLCCQHNTRWVDSDCHPSEVGKMSTCLLGRMSHFSMLRQIGDLSRIMPLAKEKTALAALCV